MNGVEYMKIAVIGAGSWGTALSAVLAEEDHRIRLWARRKEQVEEMRVDRHNPRYLKDIILPDNIEPTNDMAHALEGAELVVLGITSQAVRPILDQAKVHLPKEAVVVNISKGIEMKTLLRISEVVEEIIPGQKFVALSGPSHAEEVCKQIPTTLVSASLDREAAELVQDTFTRPYLRVYTNPDLVGVEVGGALKNIIALGAGISDGLGYGDNAKAALMTRGIREIARLGIAMGAKIETFSGLSGIGDLIVTCTSMHSRNRRCGILIGQGEAIDVAVDKIGMAVEGIYTIQSAYGLSQKFDVDMPITAELYKVVYENYPAKDSVPNLMLRSLKHEMEEAASSEIPWE